VHFSRCKANARVKTAKTGQGSHSSEFLCCSVYCLFCVLCIVCVYMCTGLLTPGGYPIAVNKYIIYLYVFVCMYIFVYICMYVCMYVYVFVCM